MVSRRKVDKACLRCRRRKEKCDGKQPVCSPCQNNGSECIYTWQQKKRGLPEGWVHTLEKLFAMAMLRYPELEAFLLESIGSGIVERHHGFAALWTDQEHALGLWKRWRNSILAARLEDLMRELEQIPPRKLDHLPDSELPEYLQRDAIVPRIGDVTLSSTARYPPVPSNLLVLLERYFLHLHGWMPIVERPYIYQLAYKLHGSWRDLTDPEACCMLALLSNVQALGLLTQDDGEVCDYGRLGSSLLPQSAQELLPQHVQALLLLAVARLQSGLLEDAWLLLGRACQTGLIVIRQHGADETSSGARSRMGCLILDTLLSARLGLPSRFTINGDVESVNTLDEDGIEEWNPANHCFKSCNHSCPSRTNSSFNRLFKAVHLYKPVLEMHSVDDRELVGQRLQDFESLYNNPLGSKTTPPSLPSPITTHLLYLVATLAFHKTLDIPLDVHFKITNSLLPLREYVRSIIQPAHIPSIWELVFTILLDLLQARFTKGDHPARSSIDAIIAVVSELDDITLFSCLKERCAHFDGTHSSTKNAPGSSGATTSSERGQASLQQKSDRSSLGSLDHHMDIAALEQQAMSLVTTNALDAEVDWDATLLNLGFADGESLTGLEMMTPDLFFQ